MSNRIKRERLIKIKIHEQIKNYRKERGLTQEELAKELSVSRSTISSWEVGRSYPDLETIVVISDFFGITIDSLLKEDTLTIQKLSQDNKNKLKNKVIISALSAILVIIFINIMIVFYTIDNPIELNINKIILKPIEVNSSIENNDKDWNTILTLEVENNNLFSSISTDSVIFQYNNNDNKLYIQLEGFYNPLASIYNKTEVLSNSVMIENDKLDTEIYLVTNLSDKKHLVYLGKISEIN